jgi:PKD repeat protein
MNTFFIKLHDKYTEPMKQILFLILALILFPVAVFSETEPNNTLSQANILAYNGSESGTLNGTDTEDWFVINIPQGGIFTLTVKKTGAGNGNLFLYDGEKPGYPEITNIYLSGGDSPEKGWVLSVPLLSGKYYAKFLKSSDPINYQVSASLVTPAFPEDTEPNDTITTASLMPVNGSVSGNVHYYNAGKGYDLRDWYKIDVKQGGILNLKIHKKGPGYTSLRFLDGQKAGSPVISTFDLPYAESPPEGWTWSYPLLAGAYYYQIEGGSGVVDYKLDVSFAAPAFGEDKEPNDTITTASIMPVNGSVSGNVHYYAMSKGTDLQDWYKIEIVQGGILNLKIHKKGPGYTSLRFLDGQKTGSPVISIFDLPYAESPAEGLTWNYPLLPGVYYFQVEGGSGVVDYKLDVSLAAPAFGEDKEPNDTITTASIMPVNGSVSGNVHYYTARKGVDLLDWYKIEIPRGGILGLKIYKKGPGYTFLHFCDSQKAGFPVISTFDLPYAESPAEGWTWSYPVLAGVYYFSVEGGGNIVDYKLETKLDLPAWAEDVEPNDSLRSALNFPLNDSITGLLGYYKPGQGPDNWDWYVINTAEYGHLSFIIDKKGKNNGNIRMRDANTEIATCYLTYDDLKTTFNKVVPAGKYYLGFEKYSGDFQYKVRTKFTPKPKVNFTWSQTDNSFTFENVTSFGETYTWDFDDGQKVTTVNPVHEFKKPDNYNVCLISYNKAGSDTICKKLVYPGINRISPDKGGNTGEVSVEIFGGGLDTFFVAKIMIGNTLMNQSNLTTLTGKSSVMVRFNLQKQPVGTFDLVIDKPSGPSYLLNKAFTIEAGTEADPWIKVTGRNRILFNTWTNYTVQYGNNGNVDARVVPVWLAFSRNPGLEVDLSSLKIIDPDATLADSPMEGQFADLDSLFGQSNKVRVYGLIIPVIQAGSVNSFDIRVKSGGDIKIDAWTDSPWQVSTINQKKSGNFAKTSFAESGDLDKKKTECFEGAVSEACNAMGLPPTKVNCVKTLSIMMMLNTKVDKRQPDLMLCRIVGWASKACGVSNRTDRDSIANWTMNLILNYYTSVYNDGPGLVGKSASLGISTAIDSCKGCYQRRNPQIMPVKAVTSLDPNEKAGPSGYGLENYISSSRNFPYTIYFENKASASAPAHTIIITDILDKTKFNLSSFDFGNITVGDSIIQLTTGLKEFVLDKKLDKLKVMARISGKLDTLTGKLEWKLRSLDPVTLADIEDPDIGLLPPNKTTPEGQGSVSFFVKLKTDPVHKSNVTNQASIVFDANPAIVTNKHLTTFDLAAPLSAVQSLSASTSARQFTVKWSGTDDGSGIENYNIYVKKDNGPYSIWLAGTKETSAVYKSPVDGTYQFSSMATDKTGNVETLSDNPDATTNVVTAVNEARIPAQEIKVYPTPFARELVVNIGMGGRFTLRVYGTDGRLRMEKMMEGNSITSIKTGSLPHGLYLWQLINDKASIKKSGKFVINE